MSAVGIGTAGAVDPASGRIVSATDTLPGWAGTALTERVSEALAARGLDLPVCVLNDVDAHALGELRHGAAAGARHVLVVAAGTGIGAAAVLDGQVLGGAHHMAGEMGHMPVPGADHLRCPCGRRGHLEAIASGAGLSRLYTHLQEDQDATLPQHPFVPAREVVARAEAGEPTAQTAVDLAARALGSAIAGLVTVLDPQLVLLTGGLAQAGPRWWRAVDTELRTQLVDHLAGVPLIPSTLPSAAIIGAAEAARDRLEPLTTPTTKDRS